METTTEELRALVDAKQAELAEAQTRLMQARRELAVAPDAAAMENVDIPTVKKRRWMMLLLGLALSGLAGLGIQGAAGHYKNTADLDQLVELELVVERANAKAAVNVPDNLREVTDEEVLARRDAAYPEPTDPSSSTAAYPGLRYKTGPAVSLRWAHIGVAACRIGDTATAAHAHRVLRWVETMNSGYNGLVQQGTAAAEHATTVAAATVMLRGNFMAECLTMRHRSPDLLPTNRVD